MSSAPYNCVDIALLYELLHCSGMPTVVVLHHSNPCGQTVEWARETGVPPLVQWITDIIDTVTYLG